jgi:hypothetical protein
MRLKKINSNTQVYGRREFIWKHFFLSSFFLSACVMLSKCGSKKGSEEGEKSGVKINPCDDLSGVSKNDIETRKKFGYVKKSPLPDKSCNNCKLHIPPPARKECGECLLFKGPVYSSGYCTYWAPRD